MTQIRTVKVVFGFLWGWEQIQFKNNISSPKPGPASQRKSWNPRNILTHWSLFSWNFTIIVTFGKWFTILKLNCAICPFLLLIRNHPISILQNSPVSQVCGQLSIPFQEKQRTEQIPLSAGSNDRRHRVLPSRILKWGVEIPGSYESGTRHKALSWPDMG